MLKHSFDDRACDGTDILDGEIPSEHTPTLYPFKAELEQAPAQVDSLVLGDFQICGGRLFRHVVRRCHIHRDIELGPALYIWPGFGGAWLESSRGGFGIPPVTAMFGDAFAAARSTVLRRYRPEPDRSRDVIDYVLSACFGNVAMTPYGQFEADSPEAFEALELCAVRRGCSHD